MFYTCLLDHRESRGTWGKALSVAAGKLSAPSTLCSIPKASCSANRAWERCVRNEPLFPKGKWGIERIRRSKQLGCARENGEKKGGEKKKRKRSNFFPVAVFHPEEPIPAPPSQAAAKHPGSGVLLQGRRRNHPRLLQSVIKNQKD